MTSSPSPLPPPVPTPLAKLGRPRLHQILPRERLFADVDRRRRRPALWIAGPPGAGKSTLLASYLDARRSEALWFQCDAGDQDLSTWFYYLGEAVSRQAPDHARPPLLTPEYLADVPAFGRHWFRQCYASVGVGLLVLDNYQEASNESLDALLHASLADVPDGLTVVFISRSDPPAAFARAVAHGDLSVIGWDSLRLSLDEARVVATAAGVLEPEKVSAIWSACEGWAAGFTLMLERAHSDSSGSAQWMAQSRETLFAYFTGQVFDALPVSARRALALCSLLPRITIAQAAALTGNPDTGDLLEQLHRRHLFTHRRFGDDAEYEFHALFRDFLRAKSRQLLEESERREGLRKAAALLSRMDQTTEALLLHGEAGDWDAATALIAANALRMLAQGRGQTLLDWISALPVSTIETDSWMQYWQGAALLARDQQSARAVFTRVHERFVSMDDFAGQLAAASGVLDTYFFSYSSYVGLANWTGRLADLLDQETRFTSAEQRLQACASFLLAGFFGDGRHPALSRYASELQRLIHSPLNAALRLRAGTFLISYAGATLQPFLADSEMELLESLAAGPALAPLQQAQWQSRNAYLCYLRGEFDLAEARLRKALRLCEEHGLRAPLSLINQFFVFVRVAKGDVQGASGVLDSWEQLLTPERPIERSQWNVARMMVWSAQGRNRDQWVQLAHEVAAQMDATGQTWIRVSNRLPGAYALIECGEHDSVTAVIGELRSLMNGTCFVRFERDVLLLEAALALKQGRTQSVTAPLGEALRLMISDQVPLQVAHNRRMLLALLRAGNAIAALRDAARAVAARYGFDLNESPMEPSHVLRVRTLGAFELYPPVGAGKASGKIQHRPLELLKFLVAQGEHGTPLSAVQQALWPDSDGDRAANALKVAIHRLRRLLRSESAIVVTGGSVTLDTESCPSDVIAFEGHAEQAERRRTDGDPAAFEHAARAALALYKGPFLPDAEAVPWVMATRERLAGRALQLTLALGAHCEALHRADEALTLFESALTLDGLAEQVYQRLMQLHLRCGRPAEAMQVYRRCRQMLSVVLGITPTPATQALFRQAQAGSLSSPNP